MASENEYSSEFAAGQTFAPDSSPPEFLQNHQPENVIAKSARDKWGHSLDAGFQIFPDVLLRCQKLLGLESTDIVILLNITMHWWDHDDLPHPRPSIIAQRMNLTTRTVERRIGDLQNKGFLQRLPARLKNGKTVRPFDLSGLVAKLNAMSEGNLTLRRARSGERTAL